MRKRIEPAEAAFISLLTSTPENERDALLNRNKNAIKTKNALEIVGKIMDKEITESCWVPAEEYIEGNRAFLDKKLRTDNPYYNPDWTVLNQHRNYQEWDCGWCDGEGYHKWLNGERLDIDVELNKVRNLHSCKKMANLISYYLGKETSKININRSLVYDIDQLCLHKFIQYSDDCMFTWDASNPNKVVAKYWSESHHMIDGKAIKNAEYYNGTVELDISDSTMYKIFEVIRKLATHRAKEDVQKVEDRRIFLAVEAQLEKATHEGLNAREYD